MSNLNLFNPETDYSKKLNEDYFDLCKVIENRMADLEAEKKQKIMEENIKFSEDLAYSSLSESSEFYKNSNYIEEENYIFRENLARESFFHIVYQSLPIDKEIKKENSSYIEERCDDVFNSLLTKGLLSHRIEHGAWDNVVSKVDVVCEETNYNKQMHLKEHFFHSINNLLYEGMVMVQSKVQNAILNEKLNAKMQETLKDKKIFTEHGNITSMFRDISAKNMKIVMEEQSYSREQIKQITLLESILDYTILESLNTFKIIEFDYNKIDPTLF